MHSVEELDFDEIFKLVMLFIDDVFKLLADLQARNHLTGYIQIPQECGLPP